MGPTLLIASPQMHDPFFERTVVLVWHHDEDGAVGIVINKSVDFTLPEVLELDDGIDASPYRSSRVGWGGPVEPGAGTVITPVQVDDGSGIALPGLSITRSQESLLDLLRRGADLRLCMGYAGWGAGQLDSEIEQGGWLATDVVAPIIFETPEEERYTQALATLGLQEHMVWMQPIDE